MSEEIVNLWNIEKEEPKKYVASPINFWGNKGYILSQLIPNLPKHTNTFVDLFCGSTPVGTNVNADKVYFIDSNKYLINLLKFLKDCDFDAVLEDEINLCEKWGLSCTYKYGASKYAEKYNKENFYKLRDYYNSLEDKNSKEANEVFYLLYCCSYNRGWIRFNKDKCTLSCGKYDLDKTQISRVRNWKEHIKNKNVEFICGSFEDEKVQELCFNSDFVYLDPPYILTNAIYNKGWTEELDKKVYDLLEKFIEKKIPFCLSNVLETFTDKLNINEHLKEFLDKHSSILEVKPIERQYASRHNNAYLKFPNRVDKEIIVLYKPNK